MDHVNTVIAEILAPEQGLKPATSDLLVSWSSVCSLSCLFFFTAQPNQSRLDPAPV